MAVALAYVVAALVGRAQEAANVRILGIFDPVFLWIRVTGSTASDWLERHVPWVAGALSGGVLLILLSALIARRRLPMGVLAPCLVLLLAIWGQALLLMDVFTPGAALYLLGVVAAAVLGFRRPMRRVPGFPGFGADPGAGLEGSWRPSWVVECVIVAGIGIVALIYRTWGLTEISDFLDLETVNSWVQSRTLEGVADYYRYTFLASNPGAAHMLPQWALFHLFGTSIFMLRMAAVLWGVAATLLMYWLVRRIAGVAPAILAAMLLATAPDQLFWSRSENGFFSPVPVLALLTVHVSLWMAARFSFLSVLTAAVLMPASRSFYTTCLAMFLLPCGRRPRHAVRARRLKKPVCRADSRARPVACGTTSRSCSRPQRRHIPFCHPAEIYGGTAWTRRAISPRPPPRPPQAAGHLDEQGSRAPCAT